MWTEYFNMVKLRRGRVITPRHGEIDFSRDDIPVETCKELFEEDFPYLEITEKGKQELYGIPTAESLEPLLTEKEILQETVEPEDSPPNRKKNKKRGSPE